MVITERDVKVVERYRQLRHDQALRERIILSMRGTGNLRRNLLHSSLNNIGRLMVSVGLQLQRKPLREEQHLHPLGS